MSQLPWSPISTPSAPQMLTRPHGDPPAVPPCLDKGTGLGGKPLPEPGPGRVLNTWATCRGSGVSSHGSLTPCSESSCVTWDTKQGWRKPDSCHRSLPTEQLLSVLILSDVQILAAIQIQLKLLAHPRQGQMNVPETSNGLIWHRGQ